MIYLQFYHCIYLFVWLACKEHEHIAWNLLIKSVLSLSRLYPAEYGEICFVTKKYKQNILFQSIFKGHLIIRTLKAYISVLRKHHDLDKIEQTNWLHDQNTLQMLKDNHPVLSITQNHKHILRPCRFPPSVFYHA